MKMKTLLNLIKLESNKALLVKKFKTVEGYKVITKIIKGSRNLEQLKNNITKSEFFDLFVETVCLRIKELEDRRIHELMFFDRFSDTAENIERYENQIEFYKNLLHDCEEIRIE